MKRVVPLGPLRLAVDAPVAAGAAALVFGVVATALFAACDPHGASVPPAVVAPEPAPTAPIASAAESEPPPPAASPSTIRIGIRSRRLARATLSAFANIEPRPVTREFSQRPWVQFQTNRVAGQLSLGPFVWREAPVRALHGPTEPPLALEPCATPVVLDRPGQAKGGSWLVRRRHEGDEVTVAQGKISVKLPLGAFHGGCVVDEKRLWLAWSTPERPADLFTVTLKDGAVRALRGEARPGLGGLAALLIAPSDARQGEARVPLLVLHDLAKGNLRVDSGFVVVVPRDVALAAYSPIARALVETGGLVFVAHDEPQEIELAAASSEGVGASPLIVRVRARSDATPITRVSVTLDEDAMESSLARLLTAIAAEKASAGAASEADEPEPPEQPERAPTAGGSAGGGGADVR